MTDDRELDGLDPFALLDTEAERLDAFFASLDDLGWNRASRRSRSPPPTTNSNAWLAPG